MKESKKTMKTVMLILFAAAVAGAQEGPSKEPSAKTAANSGAASLSVPAGAVEIEPNFWRYTDAQGKTWMYRRTPFGLSKWEDQPAARPAVADPNPVVATDLGDRVRFESKTPFGTARWIKKKTELNSDEKALLARAARASGAERGAEPVAAASGKQEQH